MPCTRPLRGWRPAPDAVSLTPPPNGAAPTLLMGCGKCPDCRTARAKDWVLRCSLELTQHHATTFTTLTYDDAHLPPTLSKPDLQRFLKRLRRSNPAGTTTRFFASGEYGETNGRPHYHAILFGNNANDAPRIESTWGMGMAHSLPCDEAKMIQYVAGYVQKFNPWEGTPKDTELLDYSTGELYKYQPPFIQMSRRKGIGAHAKQWPASWRSYSVMDGHKQRVPRYYHQCWKDQASENDIQELELEKTKLTLEKTALYDSLHHRAQEAITRAKQKMKAEKRKL